MAGRPVPDFVEPRETPHTVGAARPLAVGLLVSLRPHQWTKNLIIFAALIFGRRLEEPDAVLRAIGAFAVFCALSGAVYLVNDIADREADRRHPVKARRPIAAGEVPVGMAGATAAILAGMGLAGAFWLGRAFGETALAYLALFGLYSGPLKRIVIVDVLTIALGFVLRAVAGAVAVEVPFSHWLLVLTLMLALFLGFAKRRHELVLLAGHASGHRESLGEYSAQLLDQMIAIVAAATLVAYVIYTVSPETVAKFGTDRLGLTLPFPVYGLFRYLYLVYRKDGGGSPSEALLADRPLLACVALWGVAVIVLIYFAGPGVGI
jgi:4-hydroxybenzoate polyprenyltransferase